MKRTKWRAALFSCWPICSMLAFSAILLLLYRSSQYKLFSLGSIFLLLLASVNLLLWLFGLIPERLSAKKTADPAPANHRKRGARGLGRAALSWLLPRLWRIRLPLEVLSLTLLLIGVIIRFSAVLRAAHMTATLAYWQLVTLVALFIVTIVLDKICKHAKSEETLHTMLLRNARLFFALTRLILILIALPVALSMLQIYDIKTYAVFAVAALFFYAVAMILISLAARLIRRELATAPGIVILLPFLNADIKDLAILSFLEENTGITLRSLWSLKFIRSILPYSLIAAALIFWLSTGIVYVESHQEAAVYRFGHLQEETLDAGLHLTLPYPFDKVELYNTKTVSKVTIGYKSAENVDNVWTSEHGKDEYKLLLGSGNELVSINLRLEYRISDLHKYLSVSAAPEQIVQAKAYELITDRTINTDLETILSIDRESFANTFRAQLIEKVAELDVGIEIINVIAESIHPPVEVAQVYQDFIGAEIDAEAMILNAEASAIADVAYAEYYAHDLVNAANISYYQKIAAAEVEIAEFMAAVEASEQFPDEYTYYKYLEAICSAYSNARLVILGDGVDGSRLYFGTWTQSQP